MGPDEILPGKGGPSPCDAVLVAKDKRHRLRKKTLKQTSLYRYFWVR